MEVFLKVQNGAQANRTIALAKNQRLRIGRTLHSDLVLRDDPKVSSAHCQVDFDGSRVALKDLKSSNGTYVNDQGVSHCELRNGDRIRLGSTCIEVILSGISAPHVHAPPPAPHHPQPAEPDSGMIQQIQRPPESDYSSPPRGGSGPIMTSITEPQFEEQGGLHPGGVPGGAPGGHYPAGGGIMESIDLDSAESSPRGSFGGAPRNPGERLGQTDYGGSEGQQRSTPFGSVTDEGGSDLGSADSGSGQQKPWQSPPAAPQHPSPNPVAEDIGPDRRLGPLSSSLGSHAPMQPADQHDSGVGRASPIASHPSDHPGEAERDLKASPIQDEAEPPPRATVERRVIPGIPPGRRTFQASSCPGGVECYVSDAELEDPAQFQPTSVVHALAATGPAVAVLHFQKANLETPADLEGCLPVMDWLPHESAFRYGPVIVPYAMLQERNLSDCIDLLWDQDGCEIFIGSDINGLSQYLAELIRKPIPNFNPGGGYFYYCWPSVLGQILLTNDQGTVDAICEDVISALLTPGDKPGSWRVIGRPGFAKVLQGAGLTGVG